MRLWGNKMYIRIIITHAFLMLGSRGKAPFHKTEPIGINGIFVSVDAKQRKWIDKYSGYTLAH